MVIAEGSEEKNGQGSRPSKLSRVFLGEQSSNGNGQQHPSDRERNIKELEPFLEFLPDAVAPYLQVFQPYTARIVHWVMEYSEFREESTASEYSGADLPVNALTKKPLDLAVGLYKNALADTRLGRMLAEFNRSQSYRDFLHSGLRWMVDQMIDNAQARKKNLREVSATSDIQRFDFEPLSMEFKNRPPETKQAPGEIQHRSVNNLQGLISLLRLMVKNRDNEDFPDDFLQQMIDALNDLISGPEELRTSRTDAGRTAPGKHYVKDVTRSVLEEFLPEKVNYRLELSTESLVVSFKKLPQLGMVVNELVSNLFDPGDHGRNSPSLEVLLTVSNGKAELGVEFTGESKNIEGMNTVDFKRMVIVRKLVQHRLGGSLKKLESEQGTGWVVSFPLENEAKREKHPVEQPSGSQPVNAADLG